MATVEEVRVPDIGDFKDVPVIEVLVKPGDRVAKEAPLIALESDKATMEVPSPAAGVIKEVKVKVGDKVSQGTVIATIEAEGEATKAPDKAPAKAPAATPEPPEQPAPPKEPVAEARAPQKLPVEVAVDPEVLFEGKLLPAPERPIDEAGFRGAHASPSVRRLARELGVDLARVKGAGPKGRILKEDVEVFVKTTMARVAQGGGAPSAGIGGLSLAPWPKVDFAKFGPIERKPLTRIQRIAGPGLVRNSVMIPHVTNHDDADVTELEAFRVKLNKEQEKEKNAAKVTLLAFLMKACVSALQKYPAFNSSLDGDELVLKRYYHIGFAADTPQGLLVPVIKDADKKGVMAIAHEMSELAAKARDGKLGPADMQGSTFTISSLGGIGGTYFTPIINAPEVAILGVCRAAQRPIWDGEKFVPRLILPLSLSWDHRVVDGAAAARFNAHLAAVLADARRLLL